ncbi:hypothetical protein [Niveispirillum sp. KHB5.9]|uniref:hypothetical protein n=1 Tax=Niveispirillum sp. KHB5.9 TaxID=3400269 RepID=UPI003A8ACF1D
MLEMTMEDLSQASGGDDSGTCNPDPTDPGGMVGCLFYSWLSGGGRPIGDITYDQMGNVIC